MLSLSWDVTPKLYIPARTRHRRGLARSVFRWCVICLCLAWSLAALSLLAVRKIDPPFTVVHIQRHIQAWMHGRPYHKDYEFVRLNRISTDIEHAVIAAEDARFFQHHGFDWHEIQVAAEEDLDKGRSRGASTITQRLVKNLFFGTGRSFLRKGAEFTLVPIAELVLGKRRILELYLNVVEWGPGIYGAEAASRYYYGIAAGKVGRQQAVKLAAILPAPLTRRPARMNDYSGRISERMRQMGW